MKILVIDDMQARHDKFNMKFVGHKIDRAYNMGEALELLKHNLYETIFLDMDLAFIHYDNTINVHEDNGVAIARWMIENQSNKNAQIIIHSLNPVASEIALKELRTANYNVDRCSFLHIDSLYIK